MNINFNIEFLYNNFQNLAITKTNKKANKLAAQYCKNQAHSLNKKEINPKSITENHKT